MQINSTITPLHFWLLWLRYMSKFLTRANLAAHGSNRPPAAASSQVWCPFAECSTSSCFDQPCHLMYLDRAPEQLSAADTVDASPPQRHPSPPATTTPGDNKIAAPFHSATSAAAGQGDTGSKLVAAAAVGGTPSESWAALSDLRFSLDLRSRLYLSCGVVVPPAGGQSSTGSSRSSSGGSGGDRQRFAGTTPFAHLLAV